MRVDYSAYTPKQRVIPGINLDPAMKTKTITFWGDASSDVECLRSRSLSLSSSIYPYFESPCLLLPAQTGKSKSIISSISSSWSAGERVLLLRLYSVMDLSLLSSCEQTASRIGLRISSRIFLIVALPLSRLYLGTRRIDGSSPSSECWMSPNLNAG